MPMKNSALKKKRSKGASHSPFRRPLPTAALVVQEIANWVRLEIVTMRLIKFHRHLWVLFLEYCLNLVVPLIALGRVVDAIPEANTLTTVSLVIIFHLSHGLAVEALRAIHLVERDLPCFFDVVGAITLPSHCVALSARFVFAP